MSFSDSAGRGGTSGRELAGLFFLCIWEEDFEDKSWAGREGRRQREVERIEPLAVSSAGQPPGISTSSSQEWDIVLALVLISLCEELQSCCFSVCTRKAVKSYERAASWQTL